MSQKPHAAHHGKLPRMLERYRKEIAPVLAKHFERRSQQNQAGGIIEREAWVALSKLAVFCPKCRRASRAGWVAAKDGAKQRICRRCKDLLP